MKPTGVYWPVRRGEPYKSVVRAKFVSSCDAIVTCVLPVLCVLLRLLAQCSIEPIFDPTGFVRCPFGCSAGACSRRTGFGTPYGQS